MTLVAEIVLETRRGEITLSVADVQASREPSESPATLLDAVRRAGLPLGQSCRGEGVCRSCTVEVLAGADALVPPGPLELRQLRARPDEPLDRRLACQVPLPAACAARVVLAHPSWGRPPRPADPATGAADGSPAPVPGATVDP